MFVLLEVNVSFIADAFKVENLTEARLAFVM